MNKSIIRLVLFCFLNTCCLQQRTVSALQPLDRIDGGTPVPLEDYPYVVNIWNQEKYRCGGTLLSSRCVLTAAHCVHKFQKNRENLRVYGALNSSCINAFGSTVENIFIPSAYKPGYEDALVQTLRVDSTTDLTTPPAESTTHATTTTTEHSVLRSVPDLDVAIVLLANRPCSSISVVDIDVHELEAGNEVIIAGYGSSFHEDPTSELKILNSTVTSDFLCRFFWGEQTITDNMFCVDQHDRQRPCARDTGGPVLRNGKQVGIVSTISPCGHTLIPNIYTRLSNKPVKQFIRDTMDSYC